MHPDDILFGQIAIKLNFVTQAQISECLALQQGAQGKRLGHLCFERGYLTREQIELVVRHQLTIQQQRQQQAAQAAGRPPGSAAQAARAQASPAAPSRAPGGVAQPPAQRSPGARPAPMQPPGAAQPAPQAARQAPRQAARSAGPQLAPPPAAVPQAVPPPTAAPQAPTPAAQQQGQSSVRPQPILAGRIAPHPALTQILATMRQRQASDVHIVAGGQIATRVAGELTRDGDPLPAPQVQQMLLSIMTTLRQQQLERQGYSDFAVDLPQVGRFRVNVGKQATGLKGCFRAIPAAPVRLEQLGLPAEEIARVCQYHQGLAIVSGPNGQGKTTTLAAIVDIINRSKPYHIITVEDPVEILYPVARAVVSQREVGVHTQSFGRALKGALREDPDVIVIGELRDVETVEIALEAAETGHLVVATMSTRSGAKTIDRLIDMFPPDKQGPVRHTLAGALKIIVSQRLIPSADGKAMCAAAEVISGNVQLWNLIRDNKLIQLPSLLQRGRSMGMLRFDESLKALVQEGKVSEEVAMRYAEDQRQFREMLVGRPGAAAAQTATPSSEAGAAETVADEQAQGRMAALGGFFRRRK